LLIIITPDRFLYPRPILPLSGQLGNIRVFEVNQDPCPLPSIIYDVTLPLCPPPFDKGRGEEYI
jgi:hypothetical protein